VREETNVKKVPEKKDVTLLVISADGCNWNREFSGVELNNNKKIVVVESGWSRIHVEASGDIPIACTVIVDSEEKEIYPDFVLFRAFPNDLFGVSFRRQLLGLVYSGIGGVNTPSSVLQTMDRPIVHAEMLRIAERIGFDKFPVIKAKYHPNGYSGNKKRLIPIIFPTVIKVGSSYGGYGKMVANNKQEYDDITSVLALGTEYFTEEPFTKHDFEFRIQVIGPYIRCFRRNSHNNWKNQCGNVYFTDHTWEEKYKIYVDEVRQMFGGLDMFGIDVLHKTDTNEDFILEINDYAMGFDGDYEAEDKKWVRLLVIQRMNERLCGLEKKSFIGSFILSEYKREQLKGKEYLQ